MIFKRFYFVNNLHCSSIALKFKRNCLLIIKKFLIALQLFQMKSQARKIFYIGFTGFLTSIAMTACYWQVQRYNNARKRWDIIAKQLSEQNPPNIKMLTQQQKDSLYAFKYIQLEGKISKQHIQISRAKGQRTGYLVLRKIQYVTDDPSQKKDPSMPLTKQIIALDGWCPDHFQMPEKSTQTAKANLESFQESTNKKYKGILRKKQKTDYLHRKMKQSDLQKFNMHTWINLQKYLKHFNMKEDDINTNFYFQILKPTQEEQHNLQKLKEQQKVISNGNLSDDPKLSTQQQQQCYPYKYSVDNFQLPYLTPDKHRGYALFWGCTSLVGWFAIIKVLKMK